MGNDTADLSIKGIPSDITLERPQLDGIITVLSVLMIGGLVGDFRRHATTDLSFAEEGFLTPEHVFFYSMFLCIGAVLLGATYKQRRAGATWVGAVPAGYGWAVVGVAMFGLGGIADYGWHSTFGFEEGIEALVSPSHLMLAIGSALFFAAPLRSTWLRDGRPSGMSVVPVVVSSAIVLTVISLFGSYLNPLTRAYPAVSDYGTLQIGMIALIVFPLLFVATCLTLVRRFRPPAPALTVLFLVPALGLTAAGNEIELLVPPLVAGLIADGLARLSPPTPDNPSGLRVFSTVVPMAFVTAYFVVVELAFGIVQEPAQGDFELWTIDVLAGTVVLAGVVGLLLSWFVAPGMTERVDTRRDGTMTDGGESQ